MLIQLLAQILPQSAQAIVSEDRRRIHSALKLRRDGDFATTRCRPASIKVRREVADKELA
jgi:hypothetical protein